MLLAGEGLAAPPPAAAFGRLPQVQQAVVSPDGGRVAILGGAPALRTVSIATVDQPGLPALALGDVETLSLRWVGSGHVLARVAYQLPPRVGRRDILRLERNVAVNVRAEATSRLLDNDPTSQFLTSQPVIGVTEGAAPRALVLGLAPVGAANANMDTHLARKGADAERPFVFALWSVDPQTGRGALVERGDYDTVEWDVDRAGAARVRMEVDALNHTSAVMVRAKGARLWTPLLSNVREAELDAYLGYSDPEDAAYLRQVDGDVVSIVRRNLADGVVTPIWTGKPNESASLVWDPALRTAIGVRTASGIQWSDAVLDGVQKTLARALKGRAFTLVNWSDDRGRFVVRVAAEGQPAQWMLFDRARRELSPLGDEYPELAGQPTGELRRVAYKAADGLEIAAFLLLPPGQAAGARPPLVVLPHDEIFGADTADFDFLAGFLTSRGYAVLRPQFRGSSGFGASFSAAGEGAWDGRIQADLRDGVAAVAAQGLADASRVCIVGRGFAGFLAASSLTDGKGVYRCAAAIAGVFDLGVLVNKRERMFGQDNVSTRALLRALGASTAIGLSAASPNPRAAAASGPMLLIEGQQGGMDQAQLMRQALTRAGKTVELVALPNDDGGLARSASRTQTLEALEAFLMRSLPPAGS